MSRPFTNVNPPPLELTPPRLATWLTAARVMPPPEELRLNPPAETTPATEIPPEVLVKLKLLKETADGMSMEVACGANVPTLNPAS
jgi:hypothetical protein